MHERIVCLTEKPSRRFICSASGALGHDKLTDGKGRV